MAMEPSKAEGKRRVMEVGKHKEAEGASDSVGEDSKRRRALSMSEKKGNRLVQPSCQVEDCKADLKDAKLYHRRHKVCEHHAKAPLVLIAGARKRFCQQCSRFHDLAEFDDTKRSCRRRLAGHNERRRKSSSYESNGDG